MDRYCELANKTTQQFYKVATPCMDDHQFKIVLKCPYLARIGRPESLWSVNKLARAVTKWTKACDKRLARLISCNQHTCEYRQYCYLGNTAQQCRLGLFQDSDFAGDLEDSKSHQVEFCAFSEAIRLFQSVGCVRNRLQFHTVLQKLKSFLSMEGYAWTVFPLSLSGIW